MSFEEYKNRLIEIRCKVNQLIDDIGGTYSNAPEMLEKVLNIAMNGDFESVEDGKIKTNKIITVSNFRAHESWFEKPVYM